MVNVRVGDYIVEVISKGRKRGKIKVFRRIKNAREYAKAEYNKGKAVVLDKILKYDGQRQLAQKGMSRTGFKPSKYVSLKDYGNI